MSVISFNITPGCDTLPILCSNVLANIFKIHLIFYSTYLQTRNVYYYFHIEKLANIELYCIIRSHFKSKNKIYYTVCQQKII